MSPGEQSCIHAANKVIEEKATQIQGGVTQLQTTLIFSDKVKDKPLMRLSFALSSDKLVC